MEVRVLLPQPVSIEIGRKGVKVETSSAITSTAFSSVITALQAQLSVATIVEVLAYTAGICVTMVFVWWGVRKASRALMAAFRRGRLKL